MKKQELLKNLENTLDENKAENSKKIDQMSNEIINELAQNLEKRLNGVPQGIMKYILNKIVLSVIFTSITLSLLAIWGIVLWQIKQERETLMMLEKAQANYSFIEPYIKLGQIEVFTPTEKNPSLILATKTKAAQAYKSDKYTAIFSLSK